MPNIMKKDIQISAMLPIADKEDNKALTIDLRPDKRWITDEQRE